MIKRKIKDIILKSLKTYPVVGILGSRQVGKTTLAKAIKEMVRTDAIYLDLELPSDLNKLQDAELYLRQFEKSLVIIDEIQRIPSLFPLNAGAGMLPAPKYSDSSCKLEPAPKRSGWGQPNNLRSVF